MLNPQQQQLTTIISVDVDFFQDYVCSTPPTTVIASIFCSKYVAFFAVDARCIMHATYLVLYFQTICSIHLLFT